MNDAEIRLTESVMAAGLLLENRSDDETIGVMKSMRVYLEAALGKDPDGEALTEDILRCVLAHRHEIRISCSVRSTMVH
jgi:hypothetical protein